MGNCTDDSVDCPLCMEPLEVDDLNFYPCTCGYQICRFCWHRIRTDENELCPACRKAYPENPADFTPLSQEQITALKTEKRQRDQQRKQKITENRKHLANVRVVQKNLVFVVGLPPRLAEPEILKKHEYFGKYGKIHKVVINPSTTYAGVQGPSASAYVTYCISNDALRAIQSVNNIMIDGRLIKTSLGTTKYCSHFMKNQSCPKPDCMYLHDLGDSEASFTKEEMHQGKHQEYEKRLHDALIAATTAAAMAASVNEAAAIEALARSEAADLAAAIAASTASASNGGSKDAWPSLSVSPVNNKEAKTNGKSNLKEPGSAKKTKDRSKNKKAQAAAVVAAEKAALSAASGKGQTQSNVVSGNGDLSSGKTTTTTTTTTPSSGNSNEASGTSSSVSVSTTSNSSSPDISAEATSRSPDIGFDTESKVVGTTSVEASKAMMSVDEELNLISEIENDALLGDELDEKLDTPSPLDSSLSGGSRTVSESASGKSSPAAFRGNGNALHNDASVVDLELVQQTNLVKSNSHLLLNDDAFSNVGGGLSSQEQLQQQQQHALLRNSPASINNITTTSSSNSTTFLPPPGLTLNSNTANSGRGNGIGIDDSLNGHSVSNGLLNNVIDTTARFSKLDLFDDNNSFFSTNTFHQPYYKQHDQSQQQPSQFHNSNGGDSTTNSPQLPDLLNGTETNKDRNNTLQQDTIDKLNLLKGLGDFGNSMQHQGYNTDNWEALKYALSKSKHLQQQQQQQPHPHLNGLDVDDLLGMQQHQQQQQQKRNIMNSLGMPHFNGLQTDFSNDFFNLPNDRFSQMMQQQLQQHQQLPPHQQQQQHPQHPSQQSQHLQRQQPSQQSSSDSFSHVYAGNMSKFFDFHKNQQQQQQQQNQQFLQNNGLAGQQPPHPDNMNMSSLLDNGRLNSQFLDHTNGGLFGSHAPSTLSATTTTSPLHKQRMANKFDYLGTSMPPPPQSAHNYPPPSQLQHSRMQSHFAAQQQQQQQPNNTDDDLGFDPFFETQKGLAELLENEMIQQNQTKLLENCQRTRMPPPGFNHMNAFGFGVPRAQGSKILPFMNGNTSGVLSQQQQHQIQQQQQQQQQSGNNGWGQQQQMQPQNMGYDQAPSHLHQSNKSGFGSMTDWTALDPAIVSFRQFPSFMPGQQQQPPHPQQQLPLQSQQQQSLDLFMPHLNQHQQQLQPGLFDNSSHNKMKGGLDYAGRSNGLQQSGGAFGGPHGLNLPNSIINQQQQQNTTAQLNFSHSNWLNGVGEQSNNLFMNSLPNGFSANNGGNTNYDKFTIPMPPGFQNSGNKQQKAECIN